MPSPKGSAGGVFRRYAAAPPTERKYRQPFVVGRRPRGGLAGQRGGPEKLMPAWHAARVTAVQRRGRKRNRAAWSGCVTITAAGSTGRVLASVT
jgi:hypothetical protein